MKLRTPFECPGCRRVVILLDVIGQLVRVGCLFCRRAWVYRPCHSCGRTFVSEVPTAGGRPPTSCEECREGRTALLRQAAVR